MYPNMRKDKFELDAYYPKQIMQAITGEKEGCDREGACRGGGIFSRGRSFIHLFVIHSITMMRDILKYLLSKDIYIYLIHADARSYKKLQFSPFNSENKNANFI